MRSLLCTVLVVGLSLPTGAQDPPLRRPRTDNAWRDEVTPMPKMTDAEAKEFGAIDPCLQLLFKLPNDSDLCHAIFAALLDAEDQSATNAADRPIEHLVVENVWGSKGLIGNGGFSYLFTGAVDLTRIEKAYRLGGTGEAHAIVKDAMSIAFPDGKVDSHSQRIDRIRSLSDQERKKLEDCDSRYFDASKRTERRLADYIRENWKAFSRVKVPSGYDAADFDILDLPCPEPDAPETEVLFWLDSVSVKYERADPNLTREFNTDDSPSIVGLELSDTRRGTDLVLARLARFDCLKGVMSIKLRATDVSAAGIASVARFPNLSALDVSGTELKDRWLDPLKDISLTSLMCRQTKITDSGVAKLSRLVTLKRVDLSDTLITDAAFEDLAKLHSLSDLSIARLKNVTGANLGLIATCPLTSLYMRGTRAMPEHLVGLASLTKLETLYLESVPIDDDGVRAICERCPRLRIFELSLTDVTDRGLISIANLPKLTRLSLYKTKVGDRGMPYLAKAQSIQELSLSGTRVTGKSLESLSQLTNLRSLSLGNSMIKPSDDFSPLLKLRHLEYLDLGSDFADQEAFIRDALIANPE